MQIVEYGTSEGKFDDLKLALVNASEDKVRYQQQQGRRPTLALDL